MLTDINNREIKTGEKARVIQIPDNLLNGLPDSDQTAILEAANGTCQISGEDDYGNIEVEFYDAGGNIHWIWIDPKLIEILD